MTENERQIVFVHYEKKVFLPTKVLFIFQPCNVVIIAVVYIAFIILVYSKHKKNGITNQKQIKDITYFKYQVLNLIRKIIKKELC